MEKVRLWNQKTNLNVQSEIWYYMFGAKKNHNYQKYQKLLKWYEIPIETKLIQSKNIEYLLIELNIRQIFYGSGH